MFEVVVVVVEVEDEDEDPFLVICRKKVPNLSLIRLNLQRHSCSSPCTIFLHSNKLGPITSSYQQQRAMNRWKSSGRVDFHKTCCTEVQSLLHQTVPGKIAKPSHLACTIISSNLPDIFCKRTAILNLGRATLPAWV